LRYNGLRRVCKRKEVIMRVVVLIVVVGLVCCGCFQKVPQQTPGSTTGPAPGDWLKIVSFEPALPTTLHPGDELHVIIHYGMHSVDGVRIFARPYTHGAKTPGFRAHPSPMYAPGEGDAVGWFTFDKPAKVHEVRVRMVDAANPDRVLVEIVRPIKAQWVHP
jgi:hypothetical protein